MNGSDVFIYDEDTRIGMIANLTYLLAWGTNSLSGNFTNIGSVFIGLNDSSASGITLTLIASAGGWNSRTFTFYYADIPAFNAASPISIYLSNSSSTITTQISVKGTNGAGYSNGFVSIERLYTATWVRIGSVQLDYTGQIATFPLTENSVIYRFNVSSPSDAFQASFPNQVMLCAAGSSYCIVTLALFSSTQSYYWDTFSTVLWNCSWQNSTNSTVCIYFDGSGVNATYNLSVFQLNRTGSTLLCNATSTSPNATLTCLIGSNYTNNSYEASFKVLRAHSPTITLWQKIFDFLYTYQKPWVKEGAWAGWLLVIAAGSVGLWNPAAGILLAFLGLVAASMLGLIAISAPALAAIGIVAGVAIYLMRS